MSISVRKATPSDVPRLVSIHTSAFSSSPLNIRCFPPDASSQAFTADFIRKSIDAPDTYLVVATTPDDEILGWARWVRKTAVPDTTPPVKLEPGMYPAAGDQECAVRFFQGNVDATHRIVKGREHWFLSTIVTAPEAQRRGAGSALMRFGVERADEEGWMSYLNASADGKALYLKFGFEVVESTVFEDLGMTQYHMKRDPK